MSGEGEPEMSELGEGERDGAGGDAISNGEDERFGVINDSAES